MSALAPYFLSRGCGDGYKTKDRIGSKCGGILSVRLILIMTIIIIVW